jgi:hypothetical protein
MHGFYGRDFFDRQPATQMAAIDNSEWTARFVRTLAGLGQAVFARWKD